MSPTARLNVIRPSLLCSALLSSVLLSGCNSTGSSGTPAATVPVTPMCTISGVLFLDSPPNRVPLVAERSDPTTDHGFTRFRGIGGPRGNSTLGFTADVYGFNEAWLRNPFSPQVFRAQAHPARRSSAGDFQASAWSVHVQDASGTWTGPIAVGSANRGDEEDSPEVAGPTVPQLMPVGNANPQMFACAGGRSADNAERTTDLIELIAPNPSTRTGGRAVFIQDLLNGDDRFVPNAPGPLLGPSDPPMPRVRGPGAPIRKGAVQCAMAQRGDEIATRELHMLAIDNGRLYHSLAGDFGPATSGSGTRFDRFRNVSSWGDVGLVLGGGFGNVVSASIVAARPRAVSVFFIAESNGRYRLWHTVRFSDSGAWRPAADVMALSGDAPNGTVYPWQVTAGVCPPPNANAWTEQNSEQLLALWGGPNRFEVIVIRVLPAAQQWQPGFSSIYSPLRNIDFLSRSSLDTQRNLRVPSLGVSARPFRDDARPPP